MEFAPKPTNKIEQKEEIKNHEGIDFVFSENPELKKIALELIDPSFEDKKNIFGMLRSTLIDTVRDTPKYEKYNGDTLAVDNFSEESFELLLQGLEENNINIKPQIDNLNKTLEYQTFQEVIPTGADFMDYFNPSTGEFSVFGSHEDKENAMQSTNHSIELLNYIETKDEKAREVYGKYLETIFPESKVEDIVYHGTKYDFDEFSNEYQGKGSGNDTNVDLGFYFAKNRATAGIFTEGAYAHEATPLLEKLHKEGREEDRVHIINQMTGKIKPLFQKGVYGKFVATKDSKILPVLLNIKNPHTIGGSKFAETYDPKKGLEENRELTSELQTALQESDGIIVDTEDPHTPFSEELNSDNFIVSNPKQIHILGSLKDEEMFKEFIQNKKTS